MTLTKLICDEIFGEVSFVGSIGWESKTKPQNTKSSFDKLQPKIETILVYSNSTKLHFNLLTSGDKEYPCKDSKGSYRKYELETMNAGGVRGRETMIFDIKGISPGEGKQWKLGQAKINKHISDGDLYIEDEKKVIIKIRPEDEKKEKHNPFWGFFSKEIGTAETAKKELDNLLEVKGLFDTVKPTELIKRLIFHSTNKDSTILDFFAGSGTTGEAVLELNAEDGGKRNFILVQIPEKTYTISEGKKIPKGSTGTVAFNKGYMSIDEISLERLRRSSNRILDNLDEEIAGKLDGGFKLYHVALPSQVTIEDIESFDISSGLFKKNNGQLVNILESGFDDMIEPFSSKQMNVGGNSTGMDTIAVTWMVKDGYKMNSKVDIINLNGYKAVYVENVRLYLINPEWSAKQTQELVNLIGKNELIVQTIVLYGYSFNLESVREIEIGLNQLNTKVNLLKRY